jgi:hypothetical protein
MNQNCTKVGWLLFLLSLMLFLFCFHLAVQPRVLLNTVEPHFVGFTSVLYPPLDFVAVLIFRVGFCVVGLVCALVLCTV